MWLIRSVVVMTLSLCRWLSSLYCRHWLNHHLFCGNFFFFLLVSFHFQFNFRMILLYVFKTNQNSTIPQFVLSHANFFYIIANILYLKFSCQFKFTLHTHNPEGSLFVASSSIFGSIVSQYTFFFIIEPSKKCFML